MNSRICLPAVLLVIPFAATIAQEPPLKPGARVRVTAPELGLAEAVGRLLFVRLDTLRVVADSLMRIPLAGVMRIEVNRGRSNLLVVLGAIAGAAGGTAVGIALVDTTHCELLDPCEGDILGPPVFGAAIGALAGAALGVALRTDRWEEVPLDRLRVSLAPQRDGRLGFGLSVSF